MSNQERPETDVTSGLLSYYGSQLTSHASMVVGFLLALFTLVQASFALSQIEGRVSANSPPAPPFEFELLGVVTLTAVFYSFLRAVYYGYVASLSLNTSWEGFAAFRLSRERFHLSNFGLATAYVGDQLSKTPTWRGRFFAKMKNYNGKLDDNGNLELATVAIQPPLVVAAVFAILLAPVAFGSSPEWFWSSIFLVIFATYDLWRIRFDKWIKLKWKSRENKP